MAGIKDKETLKSQLQKMYWIETEMEQLVIWESRIELMGEDVDALERLANDSDNHGLQLKKWMEKASIPLPDKIPRGLPQKVFDFEDMDSPELFKAIMKYEILARDVYKNITETDPYVIEELFPDESDQENFLKDMEHISKEEEGHRQICEERVGGFKTIRGKR
ncbi:hypothetical protein [Methanohalophilus sp. RSK]|uniref:hypothetical protein n=1 Tax=Methanohalophilus sp. RSK TaxID=2485783 RepID=UPI001F3FFEDB|nr:hypothetical protein [Methanohalophilus sp. RSK]